MYYSHVISDQQHYELHQVHMVTGFNFEEQITLGPIEMYYMVMIGNHQGELIYEVQIIGEY